MIDFLKEITTDEELWHAYQANIAMAIDDALNVGHTLRNLAADRVMAQVFDAPRPFHSELLRRFEDKYQDLVKLLRDTSVSAPPEHPVTPPVCIKAAEFLDEIYAALQEYQT
jgi:hypothetical protein